jgi:uncharacterized membrane protein YccC
MRLRWIDGLVLAYGILLIGMALFAYIAHKSLLSLIMGGTTGMLEIGFAALARTNPRPARMGSGVIALLLFGMMGREYAKTGKVDFLVLTLASGAVFACLLGGHFYAMSKRGGSETQPGGST